MVQKRVPYKRRRQGRTNYSKRFRLVSSGKPRFIVRISNKYVNCQVIKFKVDGDLTISAFNSRMLSKYGFKGGKNLPSAYLAGLECGLIAKKNGVKEAVLDTGLHTTQKSGRMYAALKGFIDSGVRISHDKKILPSVERVEGERLKSSFNKAKKSMIGGVKK